MTPWPEPAASASGETNRAAFGVRTTRTMAPASCNRRTSSGALYAAIPPLTPRTIFIVRLSLVADRGSRTAMRDPRCALLRGLQRRGLLDRRCELPLHLVLLDLFHRYAGGLGVLAFHLRVRALNDLLCTLGDQQHVTKLAIDALGQSFHL